MWPKGELPQTASETRPGKNKKRTGFRGFFCKIGAEGVVD